MSVGWWHPNVKDGRVHDHPTNPNGAWSEAMHRLCEQVYRAVPTRMPGTVWKHAKGKHYLVLGLADDANNEEPRPQPQVVYVALQADDFDKGPMWIRSLPEFLERFEQASESDERPAP